MHLRQLLLITIYGMKKLSKSSFFRHNDIVNSFWGLVYFLYNLLYFWLWFWELSSSYYFANYLQQKLLYFLSCIVRHSEEQKNPHFFAYCCCCCCLSASDIYFCNRLLLFCLSLTFQCGTKHKTKPSKYRLSAQFWSVHQGQVGI